MGTFEEAYEKAYLDCFGNGPVTNITYGEPYRHIVTTILEKRATLFSPGLHFDLEAPRKLNGGLHAVMTVTFEQTFTVDILPNDPYWSAVGSVRSRKKRAHLGFCFLEQHALKQALTEFWQRMTGRKRVGKPAGRGTNYTFEIKARERLAILTLSHASVPVVN